MDEELNFNILKQILEYKLFLFNKYQKLDIKLKLDKKEIINSFSKDNINENNIMNKFFKDRNNDIYYILNNAPYNYNQEYTAIKIDYKNM